MMAVLSGHGVKSARDLWDDNEMAEEARTYNGNLFPKETITALCFAR